MDVPQLVVCLRSYSRKQFVADVLAGVVVGVVALPLAMAFAVASGVSPERGLYTAIVAGFLISALGGSRVQIGGPTGAFVVIVADIVRRHGLDGLAICTLMAGAILVVVGLARLGGIIKYIPYPVITGFTSGIAVIILSSQVKDLLGLNAGALPGDFVGKWRTYAAHLGSVNWSAAGLSALAVSLIVWWPKSWRLVPGSVAAMVLCTAMAYGLGLDVDTIGSRFGGIPTSLPALTLPSITPERVRELIGPAATVALLAAIESLLSAVVADGMTGYRHKPNTELIAQGVANLASPLFGGIPATGAIARTATNVRNGGSTPVAGMVHALTLLAVMLAFGRWASLVPMCCLAAVLTVVAYHMSEWRSFRSLLSAPRGDVAVLLTTFTLTVLIDLTVAVQVGVVLAALVFVRRMARATRVAHGEAETVDGTADAMRKPLPAGVQVCEISGPFFFGVVDKVRDVLGVVGEAPRVLILRLRQVPLVDATGLHALGRLARTCARAGTTLVVCSLRERPKRALHRSECLNEIGRANVVADIDEALARAEQILAGKPATDGSERHEAA